MRISKTTKQGRREPYDRLYILFCAHNKPLRVLANSELRQRYWEDFKKGIEAVEGDIGMGDPAHIGTPSGQHTVRWLKLRLKSESVLFWDFCSFVVIWFLSVKAYRGLKPVLNSTKAWYFNAFIIDPHGIRVVPTTNNFGGYFWSWRQWPYFLLIRIINNKTKYSYCRPSFRLLVLIISKSRE